MKFLANENFPFQSVELIKGKYDIMSIAKITPGISDKVVLSKALDEDRIILTFDSDYGEIIFKERVVAPPAVIYFRIKGPTLTYVGNLLLELIEDKQISFTDKFSVVDSGGVRQRSYQ